MKTMQEEIERLEQEQDRFSNRYAWWFVGFLCGVGFMILLGWLG